MFVCIAAKVILCMAWCGVTVPVRVRYTPSFSLSAALPRQETPKEDQGGVVLTEWGGENKLISLTQPAVTPPQHDINPKPRLSLFKLYESLRRGKSGELRGRLYPSLSLCLTLSISYSLVGRL